MTRLTVPKTYKLFIGGAFPRSESGRTYPVQSRRGAFIANAAQASRKDVRDAVSAALSAGSGWANATAYNRGHVLYRVAELMEGHRGQFVDEIIEQTGVKKAEAAAEVDQAIDDWVWYAGWCDKYAQVTGNANPVAGPYFNISVPEPVGVVGVVAPQHSALASIVSVLAPALVAGNTVVAIASERHPLSAISLAEVLATSDVPAGVVNVLTGQAAELAPQLAGHPDVRALDLAGTEELDWVELQVQAADTLTRVLPPSDSVQAGLHRITALTELKTVWHPKAVL